MTEIISVNAQLPTLPAWSIVCTLAFIPFAVRYPFRFYLIALFVPIALSIPTMTFTRMAVSGPYFNLYDACFLLMLAAAGGEVWRRRNIDYRPEVLPIFMLVIVILGALLTNVLFGFSYSTLRAVRWAINVPVFFLVAHLMLADVHRHLSFFRAVLAAVIIAEFQHLYFVATNPMLALGLDLGLIRSSMFQTAKSEAWLVAGPYLSHGLLRYPLLQFSAGSLFVVAAITTQTRSLALGVIGGFTLMSVFFFRSDKARLAAFFRVLVFVAVFTAAAISVLNLETVAWTFVERLTALAEFGASADVSSAARRLAMQVEMNDWIDGHPLSLLIGNGLDYFTRKYGLEVSDLERGPAFGHLGYFTYLSQIGVVGFLVYAVWFPIGVIRRCVVVYRYALNPVTKQLAAVSGAAFCVSAVTFLFSSHYLMIDVLAGTFAGFAYASSETVKNRDITIAGVLNN